MKGKVKNIKRSWFGGWKEDSRGIELLDFHLTDDGTIVFRTKQTNRNWERVELTEELLIENFELRYDISISDLLKN